MANKLLESIERVEIPASDIDYIPVNAEIPPVDETSPPQPIKTTQLMRNRRRRKKPDYYGRMDKVLTKYGVSYSAAKRFYESPLHFYNYYYGPPKEGGDFFDTGHLFEMMMLEKRKLNKKVMIYPELNLRKPSHREIKAAIDADPRYKYKKIVKRERLANALDMYQRVIHDPEVMEILNDASNRQQWLRYIDPHTGIKCVHRIDFTNSDNDTIFDLKTTSSSCKVDPWMGQVRKYLYHLQGGGYVYGKYITENIWPDYRWLVVESTDPYAHNVIRADEALIKEGVRLWKQTLKLIRFCHDENLWHLGYGFWRLRMPYDIAGLSKKYRSDY